MNPMTLFVMLYNALQSVTEEGDVECIHCQSHEALAKKVLRQADAGMRGTDTATPAPPQHGSLIRTVGIGEGMEVLGIEIRVIKKMGRKLQVAVTAPREVPIKRIYGTEV